MIDEKIVFLIQCDDQKGILAKVTSFFYTQGFNILTCQQFTDSIEHAYFMRISLDYHDLKISNEELEARFTDLALTLHLRWSVHYPEKKEKVLLLASKTSHCVYDILEKQREGNLSCHIPLIISNHPDLEYIAKQYAIPFYYLPTTGNKMEQEEKIRTYIKACEIDLIVMARYMQILSEDFVGAFPEKIINIHHAFLPAFKGANPYKRAYERGVKMIGATAHYATNDLDEGPIIEQDVERVSHACNPKRLTQIGAEVERKVLSKAIKYHLEKRIIVFKNRTIVFPQTA